MAIRTPPIQIRRTRRRLTRYNAAFPHGRVMVFREAADNLGPLVR
jgi:hypothetical protein